MRLLAATLLLASCSTSVAIDAAAPLAGPDDGRFELVYYYLKF